MIRRREFISLLGGAAAAAWPLASRAQQQGDRVRRIGVLMPYDENDPESKSRVSAFTQRLAELGWTDGRNARMEIRWFGGDGEGIRRYAAELVALGPDVILATGGASVTPLLQATRTIPIVFTLVSEPVALGFVASLARPDGNITGFTNLEPTIGLKWLELLKDMAPRITRFAVMFNPETSTIGVQMLRSAEAAAQGFAVELVEAQVRQPADIETVIVALARERRGGLILAPDFFTQSHRKLVLDLSARHELPAIYPYRIYVDEGGLMSYGVDARHQYRQAADYIDRILRGEKPADLPVQQPAKFELVINRKTAKALGLAVPLTLLATADEVIE